MKKKIISAILAAALLLTTAVTVVFAQGGKLGDMDDNGVIEAADARIILRASARLEKLDADHAKRADTNKDGRLTAADARLTLRVAARLDKFEEETEIPEESSEEKPSIPDEPTTKEEPTTKDEPSTDPEPVTYPSAIAAFFSGKCYVDCVLESGNDAAKIAVNGSDFEVVMEETSPVALSLVKLDGKKYIKVINAKGEKMYAELTKDVVDFINKVFNTDLKFDSLLTDINIGKVEDLGEPVVTKGDKETVYTFTVKNNSKIAFTVVGDKVVKIVSTDAKGAASALTVKDLSADIPAGMISIEEYAEKSILELADEF